MRRKKRNRRRRGSKVDKELVFENLTQSLREIGEQIVTLVEEAEDLLKESIGNHSVQLSRARAYWIPSIKGNVGLEGEKTTMVSMNDTIIELEVFKRNGEDF